MYVCIQLANAGIRPKHLWDDNKPMVERAYGVVSAAKCSV